jgi:hypothetical protein
VTSVGLAASVPNDVITAVISGSPVSTAGTLMFTLSKALVNANLFAAGPTSGAPSTWGFRAIGLSDLPGGLATLPIPIGSGGTGTTLNPIKRIILPYASCNNNSPAPAWDLPTSSAAVPTCKTDGVNGTVQGVLAYAKGQISYYSGIVPSDWQSWNAARITFTTSDTTAGHQVIFTVQLACAQPNVGSITDTPAYGANNSLSFTVGASAVSGSIGQAVTAGALTGGGCAPGYVLHIALARSGGDTVTDTAVAVTGWLEVSYSGTYQ